MVNLLQNAQMEADKTRAHASKQRVQVWNTPRKSHSPYLVKYRGLEYSRAAAAKSAVRRRNLCNLKAAPHIACAVALAHPLQGLLQCRFCNVSMVAQAGQLSGWPVSFRTGIPTPVWVTTQERRNSGGSMTRYLKEAAKWLRPSPQLIPISLSALSVYLTGCIMNDPITNADDIPDSWSLCDSCRLLANALINPQNINASPYLSLMMPTQLENLEVALTMPIPEHRKTLTPPIYDGLYDSTELEPAELCDQCRALNYALIMLNDPAVKEVLAFVLWERLDMLRRSLYAPDEVHDEN